MRTVLYLSPLLYQKISYNETKSGMYDLEEMAQIMKEIIKRSRSKISDQYVNCLEVSDQEFNQVIIK